ncbi:hypothetical protein V6N13_078221 [Hibiscus sabdariffa]
MISNGSAISGQLLRKITRLTDERKKNRGCNIVAAESWSYLHIAPTGNQTRVCTVAGYYSTTSPPVLVDLQDCDLVILFFIENLLAGNADPGRFRNQGQSFRSQGIDGSEKVHKLLAKGYQ